MSDQETIAVEVAYALPDKQAIVPVLVPEGTTALFEGMEISDDLMMGIFGKPVSPGQVLREGDRVEIYRPLKADPKEVRKARAAAARERRSKSS